MTTSPELRVGQGIDIHPFAKGRDLILGGVKIPHEQGLAGHSDADAVLHAVIDALLGAAGFEDIGALFPDTGTTWKGADSSRLLKLAWERVKKDGWSVVNLDISILLEAPKIAPHRAAMKAKISSLLGIDASRCGIKATTSERMGFVGRGEGIFVSSVVLLERRRA